MLPGVDISSSDARSPEADGVLFGCSNLPNLLLDADGMAYFHSAQNGLPGPKSQSPRRFGS